MNRKVAVCALALLFSLMLIPLVLSATFVTITLNSYGNIAYSYSANNYFIGQYSNGTYYAVNQATMQTYATDPNYASTLINNAIQSASQNGGGKVTIGTGNFLLNTPIIGRSYVYVQASPSTTIYQKPLNSISESISLLVTRSPVYNFVVNGGIWDGNRGSFSDHRGSSIWNTYFPNYMGIAIFSGGSDITIENVTVKNVINSGIITYVASNVLVRNCTVLNCGDNPITFNGNLDGGPNGNWNSIVEYCTVNGGQDVGINTFHADNCTIRYNTVTNVTQYSGASHWGIASEASSNVSIIGNTVSDCEYNIACYGSNTLIENNTIIGTANTVVGIEIQGSTGDIVKGNTVINCSRYQSIGTYGKTSTINLQLINNTVVNSAKIGISGTNVTISSGSLNVPSDPDGAICLKSAANVNILGVVFNGCARGIGDYGQNTVNVYIANCNFTGVSGIKVSLSSCTNVVYSNNIGL